MVEKQKGADSDKKYLTARKKISDNYGPRELWNVIDHWPLYVGMSNLGRNIAIYEILKQQLDIPGDIAEFGSWRGANLMFLTKVMHVLDPHNAKRVHCFEGFEGLQNFAKQDGDGKSLAGAYKGTLEELTDMIKLYELQDTIVIHKGMIENTLGTYLESDKGATFSLIYYDADLYEPAVEVLNRCHSRLAKGGVFVFDEWNTSLWPGEGTAVREFMEEHGSLYSMESIKGTRQPSLLLRKTK